MHKFNKNMFYSVIFSVKIKSLTQYELKKLTGFRIF